MADIALTSPTYNKPYPEQGRLIKIEPGKEALALKQAEKVGDDTIVFRYQQDSFVLSGPDMTSWKLRDVAKHKKAGINGKDVEVIAVNDHADGALEGGQKAAANAPRWLPSLFGGFVVFPGMAVGLFNKLTKGYEAPETLLKLGRPIDTF